MKVFVLSGKHPLKSSGGYATYTYTLCKSLKNLGYDVNIIAISNTEAIEETEIGTIYTVTSKYLPTGSSTLITGTFFLWARVFDKLLQKLVEKESKCVIHGIGPWSYAGVLTRRKFRDRVKLLSVYVTTLSHETYWLMRGIRVSDYGFGLKMKYLAVYLYSRFVLRRLESIIAKNSDYIIVHYDFARKLIESEFGDISKKIVQYPYSFEIYSKQSLYSRYDLEKGSESADDTKFSGGHIRCISVCRQEPRKGINYFLHALQILKQKNIPVRATIIGSGDLLEKNMRLAEKLGITDIVQFTGFVKDVSEYLSKADVFVQPSLQEGSGSLSVLEAIQSGIPVITTYCDGLPEDIENGRTGLLVPKMDSESLAEAIIRIYREKELADMLTSNSMQMVREKFDTKKMIDGLRELYNQLGS